jgi:hypothetical protein
VLASYDLIVLPYIFDFIGISGQCGIPELSNKSTALINCHTAMSETEQNVYTKLIHIFYLIRIFASHSCTMWFNQASLHPYAEGCLKFVYDVKHKALPASNNRFTVLATAMNQLKSKAIPVTGREGP